MHGIYPLKGVVKHYDWGGFSFIPSLLQQQNPDQQPFAEYWMGTHALGMGLVKTAEGEKELISLTGMLSFLFKVLDVKDMLSIQVHPSKQAAEKEFARENAEGIPLHSPQRNYRDANHKPELMVALGDFWLLHGFKPAEELIDTLLNVTELRELLPIFNQRSYAGLYKHIMEMPQAEVNRILQPLLLNLNSIYQNREPSRYDEDFWAAKAANLFAQNGTIDRGIFSIYLLNLVHLKNGEGIFQAAGVPHAYLEGRNVEIMASSDNVLRGGLTNKHVDVKELMKHIKCEGVYPEILTAEKSTASLLQYKVPVSDFVLEKTELAAGNTINLQAGSSEILLVTEGEAQADGITLKPGQPSAIALADTAYSLKGVAARTVVFRAGRAVYSR
jgi:mannose-6-phosphate isomerase